MKQKQAKMKRPTQGMERFLCILTQKLLKWCCVLANQMLNSNKQRRERKSDNRHQVDQNIH